MNNLYTLLKLNLLVLAGFLTINAQAQTHGTISGTVTTSDGKPAEAVSVVVKELNRSAISSEKGSYTIKNVKPGTYVVKSVAVGLVSKEATVTVAAGQNADLNFTLSESAEKLSEVVVTGYKSVNQKPVSAGKVAIKPLDNPQMVQVIGSAVIQDQQVNRLSDIMKNANGVAIGSARGGASETFYSRGYSLGSNNIFKNGSRVSSGAIPEASTLESVEILKGSSALLYGNVSGGAVLNLVTKQPKFDFGGEVSLRSGSYEFYKPTVDVYGPISKKLAFRVVGTAENAKSFRNNVESKRAYVNPSLLYKFSNKTTLVVQGDYLDYNNTPDFGIGSLSVMDGSTVVSYSIPTNISRNASFNTPWAYNKGKQATASANLNHEINSNWKLNSIIAVQEYKRDYFSTERIVANNLGDWSRSITRTKTDENYYNGQVNLTGNVKTWKLAHTILVGGDAENYINNPTTFKRFAAAYDKINLFDPTMYANSMRTDMPSTQDSLYAKVPTYRFGVYFQDLISITKKLKFMAGLRWTYQKSSRSILYDVNTDDRVAYGAKLGAGTTPESTPDNRYDRAISPRIGLVYQPLESTSIFASYSNNFVTNTGINVATNGAMKPSLIDQYEVGVKNDFLKGKLSANISYYRIINNDLAQTATLNLQGTPNADVNLKEFAGETTSDGAELDINGTIIPGLNFISGYAYNFMRFTKTGETLNSYIEGERLVGTTAHTANGSLFYTFQRGRAQGLKLGASAFYTGKRNAGWNNQKDGKGGRTTTNDRLIPLSAYTTFDLSAGYSFRKFSLLAKVSNITDELSYIVHENYSVNPIAPRQFMTTLSYKF
ncbi:TonB-dependent receptor [Desertivirga arenae]|uniref:TonB-dependent receptor n=1 Tax=Desertivirga arenae TaxID=2810309 RepID=UPI001A963F27|nr:TonB-dependent receptor [Pedobacter sp. SYSU D00823]